MGFVCVQWTNGVSFNHILAGLSALLPQLRMEVLLNSAEWCGDMARLMGAGARRGLSRGGSGSEELDDPVMLSWLCPWPIARWQVSAAVRVRGTAA
jgi:hypothetical protein